MSTIASIEIRASAAADLAQLRALRHEAFRLPLDAPGWLERGLVAARDGSVVGATRLAAGGLHFGGRVVPAGLIDTFMVAPQERGGGLGRDLLVRCFQSCRARGLALLANSATTTRFYERLGYGVGGVRVERAASLPRFGASELSVERWYDDDLGAVDACYRSVARQAAGFVARTERWWHEWVLHDPEAYRVCVREGERVTGYAVYRQVPVDAERLTYRLACDELIWLTPDALRALLGYVSQQGVLLREWSWIGGRADAVTALYGQEEVRQRRAQRWMLRIVDVVAALEARGYPPVSTTVEFELDDEWLPSNRGRYRLVVERGGAVVERGGGGGVRLGCGTLAALYGGWLDVTRARAIGVLEVDDGRQAQALAEVFRGDAAWMVESF